MPRYGRFNDAEPDSQPGVTSTKLTQPDSLKKMADLVQRGSVDPLVRTTAIQIVRAAGCGDRDDDCELHAIYEAMKHGNPGVPALKTGFLYINDPRYADYFTAAPDSLRACLKGACGGDCDDFSVLIGALLASIGWRCGMRGWGQPESTGMIHVYPVVAYPKRGVLTQDAVSGGSYASYTRAVGLDATVPEAYVGWEPPSTDVTQTAWIE